MTVLARLGVVDSRRFAFELVKPSSIAKTGASSTATVSALGSVEFSLCDSLSLDGVFSSAYDNYMVVIRHKWGGASGPEGLRFQLRKTGTDATTSSYTFQRLNVDNTSVTGLRQTTTAGYLGVLGSVSEDGNTCFLYGPYLNQPTATRNVNVCSEPSSAAIQDWACTHSVSDTYDGIKIFPSTSTFGGRVAVYGMRG